MGIYISIQVTVAFAERIIRNSDDILQILRKQESIILLVIFALFLALLIWIETIFKIARIIIDRIRNPNSSENLIRTINQEVRATPKQGVISPKRLKLIENTRELISKGEIGSAINQLLRFEFEEEEKEVVDRVLALSSQFMIEKKRRHRGFHEDRDAMATIVSSLLNILGELEETDGAN